MAKESVPPPPHPTPLFTPFLSCQPIAHLTGGALPILLPTLSKGAGCESELPSYAGKQEEGGRRPLTWLWPFPLGEPLLSSRAGSLTERRPNHSLSSVSSLLCFHKPKMRSLYSESLSETLTGLPLELDNHFSAGSCLSQSMGSKARGTDSPSLFILGTRSRQDSNVADFSSLLETWKQTSDQR